MNRKRVVIQSTSIFDGISDQPFEGAVVIDGQSISDIIHGPITEEEIGTDVEIWNLGNQTVCPGFGDTHTFFTGYYIDKPGVFEEMVDEIPGYLNDKEAVKQAFIDYMQMLNSHGVTAIKEMTFDDSCGLKEILEELEQEEKLTLRISFMSQPVKFPANIAYGVQMKEKYHSDFLSFSGFNQMTDGLIVEGEGDLLEPYEGTDSCCSKVIDYKELERQVLEADKNHLRFTLHSEGDAALHKILAIYDKCEKDAEGKLINRHGITDLELTTEKDRKHMAEIGAFAEVYLQMLMTDKAENWINDVTAKVGSRFREYLNIRGLQEAGTRIASATDLPFMIPDVPQSIYHEVYANAAVGSGKVNPENSLTITEILKAWTAGAAFAMEQEEIRGTLETGKRADITVFDDNLFDTAEEKMLERNVVLTITDGKVVYRKTNE